MIAEQTVPIRVTLWRNVRDIVLQSGWTVDDLKEMKTSESARAEAEVEGIKGPIARQFRDRISEFKKLLREKHELAVAAILDEVLEGSAELVDIAI
jgi:hypothetical protein